MKGHNFHCGPDWVGLEWYMGQNLEHLKAKVSVWMHQVHPMYRNCPKCIKMDW